MKAGGPVGGTVRGFWLPDANGERDVFVVLASDVEKLGITVEPDEQTEARRAQADALQPMDFRTVETREDAAFTVRRTKPPTPRPGGLTRAQRAALKWIAARDGDCALRGGGRHDGGPSTIFLMDHVRPLSERDQYDGPLNRMAYTLKELGLITIETGITNRSAATLRLTDAGRAVLG